MLDRSNVVTNAISKQDINSFLGVTKSQSTVKKVVKVKITTKASLEVHTISQHKDLVNDWDQCDYKLSFKHALKLHTESKHLGLKYNCTECDYKATTKSSLNVHTASKHKD